MPQALHEERVEHLAQLVDGAGGESLRGLHLRRVDGAGRTLDDNGDETFTPLKRLAIKRRSNLDGTYRWYGANRIPARLCGGKIMVRADTTPDDDARKVNRSENHRLIPPGDPDHPLLYPLRADIEANNRQLEDTLWINRAHSDGAQAQLLDLLGYALLYNSVVISLARARTTSPPPVAAEAA